MLGKSGGFWCRLVDLKPRCSWDQSTVTPLTLISPAHFSISLRPAKCPNVSISSLDAWDRGNVETFAVLPEGAPKIEGLTVGNDGNVYVSTLDPTAVSGSAQLFVFNDGGKLLRNVTIAGSSPATLGLGLFEGLGPRIRFTGGLPNIA